MFTSFTVYRPFADYSIRRYEWLIAGSLERPSIELRWNVSGARADFAAESESFHPPALLEPRVERFGSQPRKFNPVSARVARLIELIDSGNLLLF